MSKASHLIVEVMVLVVGVSPMASWGAVTLLDRPDIKVQDATTGIEAKGHECAVVVHPDDWKTVLMSVIGAYPGGFNHCLEWISTDGASTWKGDSLSDRSIDWGDPSVAILKGSPTRYFVQGLNTKSAQHVAFTDTPSAPFSSGVAVVTDLEDSADKGWIAADNTTSQTTAGRMYSIWYSVNGGLKLRYSPAEDRGSDWEPSTPISLRSTGACWGGTLAIGIQDSVLGHVYVAWPNATVAIAAPGSISFKRSNGTLPLSFVPLSSSGEVVTSLENVSFAARAPLPNGDNTGANSIPSMATDDQGNIYVAWGQKRSGGDDAHAYMKKSTDEGVNWGTAIEISPSQSDQWMPSIAWDDEAKALVAMFHDSRANVNQAEVYIAVSYDRGATFTELKVSDAPWSGNPSGANDYNGIASVGGVTYPMWCDDRDGVLKVYTSPTLIGGIENTSIVPTITHFCTAGSPRIRFQVDWSTLAKMEGLDKLTVTRPGGTQYTATASSTSKTHQLVIADVGCGNGTWTYKVESNKGPHKSESAVIGVSVSCMTCPPCPPPCELD